MGKFRGLGDRSVNTHNHPFFILLFQVDEFTVQSKQDLGSILLVRLHKEPYGVFPPTNWNCSFVNVTSPEGNTYHFPCYQWIVGYHTFTLREGAGETLLYPPPMIQRWIMLSVSVSSAQDQCQKYAHTLTPFTQT